MDKYRTVKPRKTTRQAKTPLKKKEFSKAYHECLESLGKYCTHEPRLGNCREVIQKTQKNKVEQKDGKNRSEEIRTLRNSVEKNLIHNNRSSKGARTEKIEYRKSS